ncbi:PLAC8-domain-containing protein [Sistotremastrum niveocremeum HHB9708]|nr:PLAC8-domain-containing protein [Sistotremastrum niveocremeum HHB9708]
MTLDHRNPKGLPFDQNGKRAWSHDIFSCFEEIGTCCISTFLPCVTYAQNRSRLQHLQAHGTRHPSGGEPFNQDCFVFGCLHACAGLGCILQIGQRQAAREHYRIEGDGGNDFLCSWCCLPCALTQEAREIEAEEKSY